MIIYMKSIPMTFVALLSLPVFNEAYDTCFLYVMTYQPNLDRSLLLEILDRFLCNDLHTLKNDGHIIEISHTINIFNFAAFNKSKSSKFCELIVSKDGRQIGAIKSIIGRLV
ncbi:hypothetical protein DERP_004782 [Dermatophagoides pteronyssinus]|uniref:Uncharacterized protein n=1 Tax=Dermatophagoides pteronyssinus TaxID=6956 RepID=A0ABQ8JT34_DERPT|nr:hypothetical protein DERP_004782 [Dermatophagoides pteronyssinus]